MTHTLLNFCTLYWGIFGNLTFSARVRVVKIHLSLMWNHVTLVKLLNVQLFAAINNKIYEVCRYMGGYKSDWCAVILTGMLPCSYLHSYCASEQVTRQYHNLNTDKLRRIF